LAAVPHHLSDDPLSLLGGQSADSTVDCHAAKGRSLLILKIDRGPLGFGHFKEYLESGFGQLFRSQDVVDRRSDGL
jgi:hypothetical protein